MTKSKINEGLGTVFKYLFGVCQYKKSPLIFLSLVLNSFEEHKPVNFQIVLFYQIVFTSRNSCCLGPEAESYGTERIQDQHKFENKILEVSQQVSGGNVLKSWGNPNLRFTDSRSMRHSFSSRMSASLFLLSLLIH